MKIGFGLAEENAASPYFRATNCLYGTPCTGMQSETVIKWSKYITKQQLQRHLRKEKKTVPCTNVWRALGTKPCTVERTNKRSFISKVSAKRKECQSLRQPALSMWLHSCFGQWAWAIVNHIDHANHVYQANQHCDQCCYSYWRIRRIFVNPRVMDIGIFSSRANIKRFSKSASTWLKQNREMRERSTEQTLPMSNR